MTLQPETRVSVISKFVKFRKMAGTLAGQNAIETHKLKMFGCFGEEHGVMSGSKAPRIYRTMIFILRLSKNYIFTA